MKRYVNLMSLTVTLAGFPPTVFAGTCALCRQALASGGNQGLIDGFYWSILLIAGVPLIILSAVGVVVWRQRHGQRPSHVRAASTIDPSR